MLLHDSRRATFYAYPAIATAAVTIFLLRNRQVTEGGSPGSGVTIAGAELLVRLSAIVHWVLSVGAQGFSLLLRVSTAPWHLAFVALQSDFRMAVLAIGAIASLLHTANGWLLHVL